MEDKKIVSEDALRGALGVAADKTTENTALLAEANIRAFDGIISKRNFITYPALSPGDIVYSEADNGFYTYIEQVGLDPLATDSLLPGGGSISTPKFSFMPYAEYMDGDTPAAAILYRERSTATLYRYDAATASLVRYADAQTLTAELQQVRDEFAAENDRLSTLVDALAYAADQTEPGHTLGKAFREIGYTDAESVQTLLESLEYSKERAQEWEEGTRTTFNDCRWMIYLPVVDTSNVKNMNSMFSNCVLLSAIPLLDTTNVTWMSGMFYGCTSLTTIPLLDTQKVTSMNMMFEGCSSLTTIPLFDTSKVTTMNNMFSKCTSFKQIPHINTINVTDMICMFEGCSSLTTIPLFDTSKVTTMNGMFSGCKKLIDIPMLNTSNVTDMASMFKGCTYLTTIPLLDTQNVISMSSMFNGCTSLTTIPLLDTQKVTSMSMMFYGCTSLTTIPLLDTQKVTSMSMMFYNCTSLHTMTLKWLGTKCTSIDFSPCLKWGTAGEASRQSLIDTLINYSYDRAGNGLSKATVKLHADTKALLTDEEKAQIVAKGFTIS